MLFLDLDRAMILDFFCDKDVDMMVQSVIEYPADTFRCRKVPHALASTIASF